MQNALDSMISGVGGIVGNLSPMAKAIVAAVIPLVTALVNMALAGSFDTTSIVVLGCGAVSALAVYLIPNLHKTKAVPPAPPAPAPEPAPFSPPIQPVSPVAPVTPAPASPGPPPATPGQ